MSKLPPVICLLLCPIWFSASARADGVDYERHIKPILRAKCYSCHGAIKQRSKLRLDTAQSAFTGGSRGPAVVPGKAEASLLIEAVTGRAGFRMPPDGEGTPLEPQQIKLLIQWINEGALSPENETGQDDPRSWWSYRPIESPAIPSNGRDQWSRNSIDRFIAHRRHEAKLSHVGDASRETWLRRVYLDLIGIPPTHDELLAFRADKSVDSFETVVDELLARPEYGERWARHWMDIWRYSDWYGSRGINEIRYSQRHIWRWRDWIVRSLNEDRGYDTMVLEMLAGDELDPTNPGALAATGYLGRNWYKFDRNVWMFETVERTAEAFLGLTLRCCRCHDHKYDPVSQEEYYTFRAFFEPHDVRTDPVSALTTTEKDATLGQVLSDGLARVYDKEHSAPTHRFIRGDNRYPDTSKLLSPAVPGSFGGDPLSIVSIALPAAGYYPALRPDVRRSYVEARRRTIVTAQQHLAQKVESKTKLESALESLTQSKPTEATPEREFFVDNFAENRKGAWTALNGDWEFIDGKLIEKSVGSFATIVTSAIHPSDFRVRVRYRTLQPGGYRSVGFSFDFIDKGNSQDVYTSTGDSRQSVQAFHRTGGKQLYPQAGIVSAVLRVGEMTELDVTVVARQLTIHLNGEKKLDYALPVERRQGKFALWVHNGSAEFHDVQIWELRESEASLRQKLIAAEGEIVVAENEVKAAELELDSIQNRLNAEAAKHNSSDPHLVRALALKAARSERQVTAHKAEIEVLKLRAQFKVLTSDSAENVEVSSKQKETLQAAIVKRDDAATAIQSDDDKYSPIGEVYPATSTGRRLGLARWIASSKNPRTARVAVNHIWGRHFGTPLVSTPENFGLNGATPTHPQLLDWMAHKLIESGWQMKPIHRLIVLSSTYRMKSSRQGDRLLATTREAFLHEMTEDPENKLFWRAHSRRMEAEVVRDSVLAMSGALERTVGGKEIPESQGDKSFRRSLYFRNTPNEKMRFLEVFDVADPNSCYRRKESVVPHQALALMNSGLAQDHSKSICDRILDRLAGQDEDEFVRNAFDVVLGRLPTHKEHQSSLKFLQDHARILSIQDKDDRFASGGSATRAPASDHTRRAQENLVHVLLLHNDFVTIR